MKIQLAEHAGYCFGVREALAKAQEIIEANQGKDVKIYTCGPLIHNKTVTKDLERQGVAIVSDPAEAEEGSIIIVRSHGEPESFYQKAEKKQLTIVDATCPFVSKIHKNVKEAAEQGRNIVVVGDQNHPEVKGIIGWSGENCQVIDGLGMAEKISYDNITLVAQTTITGRLWESIVEYFQKNKKDLIPLRTICLATTERQNSCEKTAKESDLMIVIGDKNSANSRKLFEIAKNNCKKTYFIENREHLPLKEIEKCDRIGVAAGASTPERIIKEVIATMSEEITENKEMQEVESVETQEGSEAVEATLAEEETVKAVEADPVVKEDEQTAPQIDEVEQVAPQDEKIVDEEKNMMHDFMDQIDQSLRLPGRGEIVNGEIVQVTNREIIVNLGYKKDGIIPKEELILEDDRELPEIYKEGDTIKAKVVKTDDGDGNILLSRKRLEVSGHWDEINDAFDNKSVVQAKVVREVKGGVIALYKEVSGFIPMSQLSDRYVEKADEFIGKVLPVKVNRVDQRRNKAVFSHKAYLAEERQKRVQEIWSSLNVGDVVEGTVMRFTDYGAFVDIGGLDGLLHISEISWGKLRHPQEALEIGEVINVKVLSMNSEKGKISLGLKQNQPEPWTVIDENYQVGQVINGKVVQIKEYGAFVELEPGLDGLVHISEIAHKRVTNIADEISVGQVVATKILEIDKERRRISLSIKETLDPSVFDDEEDQVEEDQVEEDQVEEDQVEVQMQSEEEEQED
ncbi:MAG: bifunctional 4-hydroxy-3-methylbut-2-enyl diphosphate reductase/30S ribosomal protein S1 [Eubacteriales bacterium]|nr:bifunctional 4-hydroxy-3-methylbut-2-enyl diphosphate reductase/30S ribosomal protein S1 [Eubacteriales bacterium]MDD4582723.1 bifunctional 4-hydroxy-3-methylbut-2-enyl diphosphate reductase/30S ribosomal protein S1 [Eubacteriales bacterium]